MKIGLLRNESEDSTKKWALACQKANIEFDVINLTATNWLEKINEGRFDFFLLRPSGSLSHYKNMYDERLYIITQVLHYKTYPSFEECYIYENKRLLSYFLSAQKIPHPKTFVFYLKEEAFEFIDSHEFPLVAKTSIGASGSGVTILSSPSRAKKYVSVAFSKKGIKTRFGPNRVTGSPTKWLKKAVSSPSYFLKKMGQYLTLYSHGERDFVIFQEYISHNFEWRMVRIGDSYFGHKKIKHGDKASGSKGIDYSPPPIALLDFAKELCEKFDFYFMAVDLFEDGKGGYLVNELQTIFGHVQDHLLEVNGKPGRYLFQNNQWVFEEGNFNTNESYDLRLLVAMKLYEQTKK